MEEMGTSLQQSSHMIFLFDNLLMSPGPHLCPNPYPIRLDIGYIYRISDIDTRMSDGDTWMLDIGIQMLDIISNNI